ncbi:MAG TPA: SPOR domain-containing protein [Spirochaetia bacterium]|nr:SPOR domain-containing protein [Spirochaetia bacterium]
MEQHKILLIIVSVCLFFAAVLGVGLWLFYPREGAASTAKGVPVAGTQTVTKEGKTGFDPIEYLRQSEQSPTLQNPPQKKENGDVIIVYGSGQKSGETGAAGQSQSTGTGSPAGDIGASTTNSSGTATSGTAGNAIPSTAQIAVASRPSIRSVPGLTPVTPATARSQAVSQVRSASQRSAATQKAAARTPSREYWIQLLASTHRDTVEEALGTLKHYSLSGHITTVSVGDKDYYRLRVGPYTSKQEAEKFQTWIRDIRDFNGAYVSEVLNN